MRSLSARQSSLDPPLPTVQTKGVKTRTSSASTPSNAVGSNAGDKTRQYKAQAYSDKITIASQTQRIEALQAELEEVRMFAAAEKKTDELSQNDGELIEALAQELESTEADLKDAQMNVNRLKMELKSERKKNVCSGKSVGTASTSASTASHSSNVQVVELKKVIDRQNAELEKAKHDADEGVSIMRDLDKALKKARKDRDDSRAACDQALAAVEDMKRQMEGMELELSTGNQQVELLERQCGEMKDEHSALQARYANLEGSLTELQNVLSVVQSRSEKKAATMNQALAEAEEREEQSLVEYQTLIKKYNEAQRQCADMEGVLSDLTARFEEMKAEVASKEDELEMAEARHATNVEVMKEQHDEEMEAQQSVAREEARVLYEAMLSKKEAEYQAAMNEMQMQYQKQLKEKDDLLKAREKQWESKSRDSSNNINQETQKLKAKLKQIEGALVERDEALFRSRNENAKLKTDNAELERKIERGVAMYNETASQLKAKTAEAAAVSNNKASDAELVAANKTLKRDLTSAVESSISRGKQIQALEKEIETYQLKLNKANQKMKHMETSVLSENEKQLLEQRVANLDNLMKTATAEKEELECKVRSLSAKASQVETLERDLTDARLALADSQSRIFNLEEALQETEMALRTVSSARLRSPASSPGNDCRESEIRTQIENDALKEYIGQRM